MIGRGMAGAVSGISKWSNRVVWQTIARVVETRVPVTISISSTRWLVPLTVTWLAGCPVGYALWIQEGSTATHLVFRVSDLGEPTDPVRVTGLSVTPKSCQGRSFPDARSDVWRINGMGVAEKRSSFTYGQTPDGWEEVVRAAPLTTGCYVVWGAELPPRFFRVESDGRITDEGD
jgi:hypothetical protein